MALVINEPRVLTRALTAVDMSALTPEEVLNLLGESEAATYRLTLSTASVTFTPTPFVFGADSCPDGPWRELAVAEENLGPWDRLDEGQSSTEHVEAFTSGTRATSTTVTLIRKLLRLYRDGKESFFERKTDLKTLAAEQGVEAISDLDKLRADFWPEDEDVEDFISEVRRWRTRNHQEGDP